MRWAALVIGTVLLAGCTGASPTERNPILSDEIIITKPGDFSNETSNDSRPHVHDYWNGRERLLLFEGKFTLSGERDLAPVGANEPFKSLHIDDSLTIFPGTVEINSTISWKSNDGIAKRLAFGGSRADDSTFMVAPLSANGNVSIPTNETTNDPAHARSTRWQWYVTMTNQDGAPVRLGSVEVTVRMEMVRAKGELLPAPAHPNWYAANLSYVAFSKSGDLKDFLGLNTGTNSPPPAAAWRKNGLRLIPPGTGRVDVSLHYNATSMAGLYYSPVMSWKGGNRNSGYEAVDRPPTSQVRQDQGHFTWILEIEPEMWDSPYVQNSTWLFEFKWHTQGSGIARPAVMNGGNYHLSITALAAQREATASS